MLQYIHDIEMLSYNKRHKVHRPPPPMLLLLGVECSMTSGKVLTLNSLAGNLEWLISIGRTMLNPLSV
jgi:hypothetical protein